MKRDQGREVENWDEHEKFAIYMWYESWDTRLKELTAIELDVEVMVEAAVQLGMAPTLIGRGLVTLGILRISTIVPGILLASSSSDSWWDHVLHENRIHE